MTAEKKYSIEELEDKIGGGGKKSPGSKQKDN